MPEIADMSVDELHARMLKKPLWVVMSKPAAPPAEMARHLKAHLEHQIRIEKAGIMYGAGPATKPGDAAPSFGLIIIRAKDEAEARRIADADPMHAAGARTIRALRLVAQRRPHQCEAEFFRPEFRVRLGEFAASRLAEQLAGCPL